jgi:hypothetical protein
VKRAPDPIVLLVDRVPPGTIPCRTDTSEAPAVEPQPVVAPEDVAQAATLAASAAAAATAALEGTQVSQ